MEVAGLKLTPRGKAIILASSSLVGLALIAPTYEGFTTLLSTGLTLIILLLILRYQLYYRMACLKNVEFKRAILGPRIEGLGLKVRVEVSNGSLNSLGHVELYDSPPRIFKVEGQPSAILSLPARSKCMLEYDVKPVLGEHKFESVRVVLRDPLGFYFYEYELPIESKVNIKPRISGLETKVLARTVSAPYGAAKFKRRGLGLEFSEVRDYTPGDEVRRIEWKATARTGQLKTKEYELEAHLRVLFILDATTTMLQGLIGSTKLEYSARAIGYVAKNLIERGDYVGLTVYLGGSTQPLQTPLKRGRGHLRNIMMLLSKVKPVDGDKSKLGKAIRDSIAKSYRKKGNLVIVVSDLEFGSRSSLETFLEDLKVVRAGLNRVVVISPYTPLFEIETLGGVGKLIYRLYAARSWRERRRVTNEFEKLGIPVLNVGLRDVVEVLLNRLEEERRVAPA